MSNAAKGKADAAPVTHVVNNLTQLLAQQRDARRNAPKIETPRIPLTEPRIIGTNVLAYREGDTLFIAIDVSEDALAMAVTSGTGGSETAARAGGRFERKAIADLVAGWSIDCSLFRTFKTNKR